MRFYYHAKQGPHDHREGEIEAQDSRTAVSRLISQGLTPVEVCVKEASGKDLCSLDKRKRAGCLSRLRFFQEKVFQTEIVLFSRYLADFLSAGVSVLRSLQLIRRYFPDGPMASALEILEAGIQEGDSLSAAMNRVPEVFSEMYINMIRAGETGGALDAAVAQMADFLERDHDSRLKVLSSMVYPFLILAVGCVTVFVLFTWVLPRIMVVFEDMDQTLPVITQVLMGISRFFSQNWWLAGTALAASAMLFVRWYRTPEGRDRLDRWLFVMPVSGRMIRAVTSARFFGTLGTLLNGGVDIVPALIYAGEVTGNRYIRMKIDAVVQQVSGGVLVSRALQEAGVFAEADISMLSVGEESGDLPASLFRLASLYEKEHDRMIRMITTMIEPVLILGLGLIVGFVVLAMLMPIFQMNLVVR